MQIDSGPSTTLKELIQQYLAKKLEEVQSDVKFASYKEEHPEVVEDLITQLEAKILLKQYVVDERTHKKAIECSLACLKRVIHKEEQFQQAELLPNFSARLCHKAQALIFKKLPSRCISACQATDMELTQVSYCTQ